MKIDDFDGDGHYELFAYLFDKEGNGNDALDVNCSIWFSNGKQTVLVQDIEDYWWVEEVGILQFGKNKHFLVKRSAMFAYEGSVITTCALDEGVPHTVILDKNVLLSSENGKTYCWEQEYETYDPYASGRYRERYSIFYMDGEYWEYASKIIAEDELGKYSNKEDIMRQIKEGGRKTLL